MKLPLDIGTDVDVPDVDAFIEGARFNRHTFWCGQSGSGKTYALGVVLERLLLSTGLPLLILDPNADFIGLGRPRESAPREKAEQISRMAIEVYRPRGKGDRSLLVRYVDMDLLSRAAVLRLDPIADADEYNVLRQLESEFGPQEADAMVEALSRPGDPARTRLLHRIQNLGVLEWDVWAHGADGIESVVARRPDAVVADLSGFQDPEEPVAAALATLDHLWRHREERKPLLVVIDESHNLCPAEPLTPLQEALTRRIIQIAAEGRKYGLWLLLSTQRPSKIHPQVLSQADNLCLMKTNSPADLDHLARFFGAVPRELLERAMSFTMGQGLFAGGFSEPRVIQLAARYTEEGGTDVDVPSHRSGPARLTPHA